MSVLPAYRCGSPAPLGWTPLAITSLVAWWDAENAASLTTAGGGVSAWTDLVSGLTLAQGTSAARPTYNATGFNGRPVLTLDGVDDCLEASGVGALPSGTTPGEFWTLVDQTALPADTGSRCVLSWGGAGAGTARSPRRSVSAGVNLFRTVAGDGSSTISADQASVDFSGRHVARSLFAASAIASEVDGSAGAPVACALNTSATTRTRFGAGAAAAAGTFWQGGVNTIAVFADALSASDAARLYAYLNARK